MDKAEKPTRARKPKTNPLDIIVYAIHNVKRGCKDEFIGECISQGIDHRWQIQQLMRFWTQTQRENRKRG